MPCDFTTGIFFSCFPVTPHNFVEALCDPVPHCFCSSVIWFLTVVLFVQLGFITQEQTHLWIPYSVPCLQLGSVCDLGFYSVIIQWPKSPSWKQLFELSQSGRTTTRRSSSYRPASRGRRRWECWTRRQHKSHAGKVGPTFGLREVLIRVSDLYLLQKQ